MGLFDELKGAVFQAAEGTAQSALASALENVAPGGVGGLLAKLQGGGLGEQVGSWLAAGHNLPVNADQIRAALGNEHLQQMAASMGLDTDQIADALAAHLPNIASGQ
ncbi:MAG: YidB family protein [Caulobacteraceae bacterium]